MTVKEAIKGSDVDERLSALLNNAAAVRAVQTAVEGTIGPKGLDVMLVDRFGGVVVTNDGVSILSLMEAAHPAARMLINLAKAQENEVGDGTTTATLIAGTLIEEAVAQVAKGVPMPRLLAGLRRGVETALAALSDKVTSLTGPDDPLLRSVALVACRGREDIASLVTGAARLIGQEKLREPGFRLMRAVTAKEGADNEVFTGVVIDQTPLNRQMPSDLRDTPVLCLDDALDAESIDTEALATDAGVQRYLALQAEFEEHLHKLIAQGVKAIFTNRGASDLAEEICTAAGVLVVPRVPVSDLTRVAEHTGARLVKRTTLKRGREEIGSALGRAARVTFDERLECVRVEGGAGVPVATVLVGAATEEIVEERERMAKDAAAAVQAALTGGIVPGGGALELALARAVDSRPGEFDAMDGFGMDCVREALKKPMAQIVANAGFSPLEKVEKARAAQAQQDSCRCGIDCDSGDVIDVVAAGIVDPALVKAHALRSAGDIAETILRINMVIRKREAAAGAQGGTRADVSLDSF